MDFFKSVFSDDPDPSDLQKDHRSPSQSPKKHDPDQESTFDDIDSEPNPNPNPSSESPRGSAWNFGGLIKTLASKSETVIQTYRRDLEEFGSGLKKETAIIREAATRAVKELPASIEVGASVAQESIESVGHAIDEFGNSVWRGTSEIISNSKDVFTPSDPETDSFDSQYFRHSKRYSRYEMQVNALQSDLATYCEEPDDLNDYNKWKLGFVLKENGEEIEKLLGDDSGVMEEVYTKLVPSVVDHDTFWSRYFYRINKLKQAENVRANLVKRAISGEEEDLSWDVDEDDDNSGYEAKSNMSAVNEEKKHSVVSVGVKEKIEEAEAHNASNVVEASPSVESIPINASDEKESIPVNASDENVQWEENMSHSEVIDEVVMKIEEIPPAGKHDDAESSKMIDLPVETKQPSVSEEDIEWDEIEDIGSNDDKKATVAGSPKRSELRKRLSVADDEEDLSWDIEDDEEPVKH